MRGIFFDEETVRLVERTLLADGYTAIVAREPFAGEDDDEDQPWSVVTDAPELVLEILVDRHDGWLDDDAATPAADSLRLPEAPKRHHAAPEQSGPT